MVRDRFLIYIYFKISPQCIHPFIQSCSKWSIHSIANSVPGSTLGECVQVWVWCQSSHSLRCCLLTSVALTERYPPILRILGFGLPLLSTQSPCWVLPVATLLAPALYSNGWGRSSVSVPSHSGGWTHFPTCPQLFSIDWEVQQVMAEVRKGM